VGGAGQVGVDLEQAEAGWFAVRRSSTAWWFSKKGVHDLVRISREAVFCA
jgi:hypothetical protein